MDEKQLRAELAEIDEKLAQPLPDVIGRVADVLVAAGAAADPSRANFILGQVFEAMYPVRERRALETARKGIAKKLVLLTSTDQ